MCYFFFIDISDVKLKSLFFPSAHQTSTPEAESEDSGDTEPSQVPQPTCARCASKRIAAPARKCPPSIMIMGSET